MLIRRIPITRELIADTFIPDYFWDKKDGRWNAVKRFFALFFRKHWGWELREVPGSLEAALEKGSYFEAYIINALMKAGITAEEEYFLRGDPNAPQTFVGLMEGTGQENA